VAARLPLSVEVRAFEPRKQMCSQLQNVRQVRLT
jgi:hypothetical protein